MTHLVRAITGRVTMQRLQTDILNVFFGGWPQSEEEGVYRDPDGSYVPGLLYKTSRNDFFVALKIKKHGQLTFKRSAFVFHNEAEVREWSSKNISVDDYIKLFSS